MFCEDKQKSLGCKWNVCHAKMYKTGLECKRNVYHEKMFKTGLGCKRNVCFVTTDKKVWGVRGTYVVFG